MQSVQKRAALKRTIAAALIATVALTSFSCGSIIHRDRWGQRSGRLDPSIVILDSLGLLFFFIPGVVAFIVDFSTGAIYLPENYGQCPPQLMTPLRMTRLDAGPGRLDQQRIETIVQQRVGRPIDLNRAEVEVSRLDSLDQAPAVAARFNEPAR